MMGVTCGDFSGGMPGRRFRWGVGGCRNATTLEGSNDVLWVWTKNTKMGLSNKH